MDEGGTCLFGRLNIKCEDWFLKCEDYEAWTPWYPQKFEHENISYTTMRRDTIAAYSFEVLI